MIIMNLFIICVFTFFIYTNLLFTFVSLSLLLVNRSNNDTSINVNRQLPYERIVGGSIASINDYSYLVSLQRLTANGYKHYCAGSLIKSNIVLTAAHCISRIRIKNVSLVTEGKSSPKKHFHRISKAVIHYNYNGIGHLNDLALLFLANPIQLGKLGLTTIALPSSRVVNQQYYGHHYLPDRLMVLGWGVNYGSRLLRKASLAIHNDVECKLFHGLAYRKGMICAGGNGIASCFGDSGGPLILGKATSTGKDTLFGVVSWGPETCGGRPTVFTNIIYYLDWITVTLQREIR